MKHPVLTRLFAIALAILCLIMLLAGALGISNAAKDRRSSLDDRDRLQGRIDEYNTIALALDGSISYEEANRRLEERQEQHEEDAAKHRTDLAIYSATRGGVQSGADTLEQAQSAMNTAWAEYWKAREEFSKGETAFNEGYAQYISGREELEAGIEQFETLETAYSAVTAIPGSIVDIEIFPPADSEGGPAEEPSGQTPEEPEQTDPPGGTGWPTEWPDISGWPSEWPDISDWPSEWPDLSDLPSQLPGILEDIFSSGASGEENRGGSEETEPAQNQEPEPIVPGEAEAAGLAASGTQTGGSRLVKLSASAGTVPDLLAGLLPPELEEWLGSLDPGGVRASSADREQTVAAYDSLLAACDELSAFGSALSGQSALPDEAKTQLQMITVGVALAKQGVQAMRDSLAGGTGLVTGSELRLAQTTHSTCKETLLRLVSQLEEQMGPTLEETGTMLDAAWAEIEKVAPTMEENKKMMEEGRKALDEAYKLLSQGSAQLSAGKAELDKTLEDLLNQAKELLAGKKSLERDSQELAQMAEETQQKKELERRETSLRLMLLDRPGIKQRVDKGGELVRSAEAYAEEMARDAGKDFWLRLAACVLMILGGAAGILSLVPAFEKLKSRFLLLALPVFCLVCAAAAECIFEWMGRGSSYSAIFAGIFALVLLIVVLPRAKKRGA